MRALLFTALLALPACFQVSEPICAYSCGPAVNGGLGSCPNDYTCQADNYCHRNGTTAACEFSDAATADEAVPFDLESSPDAGPDASPDL